MRPEQSPLAFARLIAQGGTRLEEHHVESPRLAAEFLLAHALGLNPAELRHAALASPDRGASADAAERFHSFIARHAQGEPVAYIIGEWEFFGIPFFISPAVLIPRPESELLVQTALTAIHGMPLPLRIADLGTGSGCLAVAVLKNLDARICLLAVDASTEAVAVARRNVLRHQLEDRMALLAADFTRPFAHARSFDLILANPPYVSAQEYFALAPNVRSFEPCAALVPDSDHGRILKNQTGLEYIAALADRCAELLRPGGRIIMEIGAAQGSDAARIFRAQGAWGDIRIRPDAAAHDRLIIAQLNG